jgi:hypothetical protein
MGIKSSADAFFIFSVTTSFMAALSWALKPDVLWLAATQWLLITIVFGVWGLYLRLRDMHEVKNGKKK